MAQKSTKNDTINRILDPLQLQVIELLLGGETVSESCRRAGVDRGTYYQWSKSDPVFIAEWNRQKSEMHSQFRDRISRLTSQAIEAVESILGDPEDKKTRLQAALAILRAGGLLEHGGSVGSTDPEDVKRELKRRDLFADMSTVF